MKKLIAAIALIVTAPAWGWDELLEKEGDKPRCAFFQGFEGEPSTTLIVAQDKSQFDRRMTMFILVNDAWSLKAGGTIPKISFEAPDGSFFYSDALTGDHGLVFEIDEKYLSDFLVGVQSGGGVTIRKGKVLVTRLDFEGFTEAYATFNKCRADKGWIAERVAADAELAEKNRLERLRKSIPRDPFARTPKLIPRTKKK